MQQGFHFFLSACILQRQLLIAVECLQYQLEDQANGWSTHSEALPEALMKQIIELSESIADQVDQLALRMLHGATKLGSTQLHQEIEVACLQLLDTNQSVAETALAVIGRYGYAPWGTQALTLTAARNRAIRACFSDAAAATRQPN